MINLELDCIPCFVRHALEMATAASSDTAVHERVFRETLREMSEWDTGLPVPALNQRVQRRLHRLTGNSEVEAAADPFEAAVRVAVAGNVIDMGGNGNQSVDDVKTSLANSCALPVAGDLGGFHRAASRAEEILYLADNTGEIVFDHLLIEQLRKRRITIAVRGAAILNDATLADARVAGLDRIAEVIDNGSDAPGTILAECGAGFRERFERADIVIAKGQGNFETLAGEPGNVFFLLKVKCPVVAAHTGFEAGTHAVLHYSDRKLRNGPVTDDQALFLDPPDGLVVIAGCAHSGIVNTLDCICALRGCNEIFALIGGLHLGRASSSELEAAVHAIERRNCRILGPCHCTGLNAQAYLRACFRTLVQDVGAGAQFIVGNSERPRWLAN
jgi:uncharacterized protein with ATP-grasp and redox domains